MSTYCCFFVDAKNVDFLVRQNSDQKELQKVVGGGIEGSWTMNTKMQLYVKKKFSCSSV